MNILGRDKLLVAGRNLKVDRISLEAFDVLVEREGIFAMIPFSMSLFTCKSIVYPLVDRA